MIKSDGASIVMGAEEDVVMSRTDNGLHIANNVTIDGTLYVTGEEVLTSSSSTNWHVFVGKVHSNICSLLIINLSLINIQSKPPPT